MNVPQTLRSLELRDRLSTMMLRKPQEFNFQPQWVGLNTRLGWYMHNTGMQYYVILHAKRVDGDT